MKTQIVNVIIFLMSTVAVKAQMPINDINDHKKCIDDCSALNNSEERLVCIAGCSCKCPNVSLSRLNSTTSLVGILDKKSVKDGDILVHTDPVAKGRTYAQYQKGRLTGYLNIYASGEKEPLPILVYKTGKAKRYFIYNTSGKYLAINKPQVQFKENMGRITKD